MTEDVIPQEKGQLSTLLEEQLTPRTQYGLVVLFAFAMIYGITSLMTHVDTKSTQAQALNAELEIWSDTDAQNAWRARAETTTETLIEWEAAAWQAESPGIAAAEIEIAIQALANAANVPSPRIEVNSEAVSQDQSDFLRFDVSGNVQIGNIPRLLILFAAHKRHLIISDVQLVTRNQTTTNFQISGVAPFKRASTGGEQ